MAYAIKDFAKFQHFKDRTPPWVKLYRDILDDPDWFELPAEAAKVLVMLWVIASEDETRTGLLPNDKKLAFRLRITEKSLKTIMSQLSHWLIQVDINPISERYQSDAPERERETETYKEETEVESAAPTKKVSQKASQIPDDFEPNENGIAYAKNKNLNLQTELSSFRNFHTAKGSTWKDWQATWRTWCDKAVEFGRAGNARASPRMSHSDASKLSAARTIFGTEIEAANGNGRIIEATAITTREMGSEDIPGTSRQLRDAVS